jgi:hypothetical protein
VTQIASVLFFFYLKYYVFLLADKLPAITRIRMKLVRRSGAKLDGLAMRVMSVSIDLRCFYLRSIKCVPSELVK